MIYKTVWKAVIAKRREDSGMHGNQGGKKKERKKKERGDKAKRKTR